MINKIIARLQDGTFVTIFNNATKELDEIKKLYTIPELTDELSIAFDPEKKLAQDEWFYIKPNLDQKKTLINPYLETIESIDTINPITAEDYPNIRAISLVEKNEGVEYLFLTKVYPRFYTMKKKIFSWNDGPVLETQSSTVDFTAKLDAFWKDGKLYFKSYNNIKSVLNGLEDFYRVATEEEKNDFLKKDFFECDDLNIVVKQRNLRKIASVLESITWSDSKTRKKYIDYANLYPTLGVNISDSGKMKIESNQDITRILNVLEERIYTTPITGEAREANSVTALTN